MEAGEEGDCNPIAFSSPGSTFCAETAEVSWGTSHSSAVSTPLRWKKEKKKKKKGRYKKKASHSCRTTCERSESAQESGE